MVPNQVLPQVPYTDTSGVSSYQPLTLNCTYTNAPSPTAVRLITLQTSLLSFKHNINIENLRLCDKGTTKQVDITILLILQHRPSKQRWIRSGSCRKSRRCDTATRKGDSCYSGSRRTGRQYMMERHRRTSSLPHHATDIKRPRYISWIKIKRDCKGSHGKEGVGASRQ